MTVLTITKQDKNFIVDDTSRPGTPYIGRGRTMIEAIGDYFVQNQHLLDLRFELDPQVQSTEKRRRARELAKR
jgi:predicted ATP-grasp superfamily ATP-dependent carboligase